MTGLPPSRVVVRRAAGAPTLPRGRSASRLGYRLCPGGKLSKVGQLDGAANRNQENCPMLDYMPMSPEQCRGARALLNLSQVELAGCAHIARATLADFERGIRMPTYNNLRAIQGALEAAGVIFVSANGGGTGVRLHQPASPGAGDNVGLSADLCRAARSLVNLSQQDLATAAGLGRSTVAEFESGSRVPISGNLTAMRTALEAAGVTFIASDNTAGPGVRLRT